MNENDNRLLVLLDGSERALDAVRYVASVKGFASMKVVVLLNVYARIPDSYLDLETKPAEDERVARWFTDQEKKRIEYMERAADILKNSGISAVETKVQQIIRGVARDILAMAKEGYSAVVLTRRGMGLLAGLPIGSVAGKLLQYMSFLPIALVGENATSDRILIAVDGSEDSLKAAGFAGGMLVQGKHVELLHVIRNQHGPNYMMDERDIEQAKTHIQDVFASIRDQLVSKGANPTDISWKIIDDAASRAGSILQEAKTGGYDTIVLGRKGLSRTDDFSMGRVTAKVVQMADPLNVWLV